MADSPEKIVRVDPVLVSIKADPHEVWAFVANLNNWKQLSEFGKNLTQVNETLWIAHTPQGDVKVVPMFDEEKLLLDHLCILPSGHGQHIKYRVVPSLEGSELVMTNLQTAGVSDEDYEQQLQWTMDELNNVKKIMEEDNI